jgi:DNA polymerase-3 subunit delta'
MIDQLSAYGKEYLKSFVGYALYMFRSSVIYNKLGKDHVNASEEEWDHIQKFSPLLKDYNVHEIITAFNETLIYIERNADIRITFLNLSLYIGTLLRLKPIEQ